MNDYLQEWTQGKDNFGEGPPNASLSIYAMGHPENTAVVIEITKARVGADAT